MSRAFVDESASESREEGAPELKIPLPAGAKNYVTPQGAQRLRAELAGLGASPQPRLREVERRIQYLSRMAAIMEVVPVLFSPMQNTFCARRPGIWLARR